MLERLAIEKVIAQHNIVTPFRPKVVDLALGPHAIIKMVDVINPIHVLVGLNYDGKVNHIGYFWKHEDMYYFISKPRSHSNAWVSRPIEYDTPRGAIKLGEHYIYDVNPVVVEYRPGKPEELVFRDNDEEAIGFLTGAILNGKGITYKKISTSIIRSKVSIEIYTNKYICFDLINMIVHAISSYRQDISMDRITVHDDY